MGALTVVALEPDIEIRLQLQNAPVKALAKRNLVELIEHRFVEPFADAVGLRALGFGARVIDIFNRQIKLVLVIFRPAAILVRAGAILVQ